MPRSSLSPRWVPFCSIFRNSARPSSVTEIVLYRPSSRETDSVMSPFSAMRAAIPLAVWWVTPR